MVTLTDTFRIRRFGESSHHGSVALLMVAALAFG